MILVIKKDGEALNLSAYKIFTNKKSATGPTHLMVQDSIGLTHMIENYSIEEMIVDTMGRTGTVIIRRFWRKWQTSDVRAS